ncbi:MAG TPA: DUF2784 domain-containing protein [Dissulfurispiraceae bacterium]|nr:DUF2784 domain-containing protein [Dissulfurispiraceae bacterium]
MLNTLLADAVVLLHFAFILFVIFGGLLVLMGKMPAWLHLPAAVWGALVELAGWFCPLTSLENALRHAGGSGYSTGFIEHYLMPIIYPSGLTRNIQILLGVSVVLINATIYGILYMRRKGGQRA